MIYLHVQNMKFLNPNWYEEGHFYPHCAIWVGFCQLNFCPEFQNFLQVKIDNIRVNLMLFQAQCVNKIPLGGPMDE